MPIGGEPPASPRAGALADLYRHAALLASVGDIAGASALHATIDRIGLRGTRPRGELERSRHREHVHLDVARAAEVLRAGGDRANFTGEMLSFAERTVSDALAKARLDVALARDAEPSTDHAVLEKLIDGATAGTNVATVVDLADERARRGGT